jgi:hypothetical protein
VCPLLRSSRTVTEPMKPDAPVTKTLILIRFW